MERALVVAVWFYEGRYHGADGWPPGPGRLFQALMAGAARGANVPARTLNALEWLERLPPPAIAAPRGVPGQAYTRFVPNNDLDAALSASGTPDLETALAAIRVGESICPVLFDAEMPVLYCWTTNGDSAQTVALCETAARLYQLGRGFDMAWAEASMVGAEDRSHAAFPPRRSSLSAPRPGGQAGPNPPLPDAGYGAQSGGATCRGAQPPPSLRDQPASQSRVFVQPPKPVLDNSFTYNASS